MPVRSRDLAGTLALMARSDLARSPAGEPTLLLIAIGSISQREPHGDTMEWQIDLYARIYNKMHHVKRQFCTFHLKCVDNMAKMARFEQRSQYTGACYLVLT